MPIKYYFTFSWPWQGPKINTELLKKKTKKKQKKKKQKKQQKRVSCTSLKTFIHSFISTKTKKTN